MQKLLLAIAILLGLGSQVDAQTLGPANLRTPASGFIEFDGGTSNTFTCTGGHCTIEGTSILDTSNLDADLTSWAGVARAAGFDTFAATPTLANLNTLISDTLWAASNDGAGSTLDADLLDGKNTGTSGNVVPLLDGANTWSAVQTFNSNIVLGSTGDITTTSANSVINLNPNTNAEYTGLTLDNDSTGGSSAVKISLSAGTTALSHLWCGVAGGGCEWTSTAGYIAIQSATNLFLQSNVDKLWTLNTSGYFVPFTDGAFDIGTSTNGVRALYTNTVELNLDTANTLSASGGTLSIEGSPLAKVSDEANSKIDSVGITLDGGGSAITTGTKGYIEVPYNATINRVTMLADQSGSCVVDVWKDTYANYPPTVADTITASAKPTITTAIKSQDSTLTGWTTSITAGDVLGFNVDSCSTITRLHLILKVTKS